MLFYSTLFIRLDLDDWIPTGGTMNKTLITALLAVCILMPQMVFAANYAQKLCNSSAYDCLKVLKGESWETLFPDPNQRMLVKKVNRMNTKLHPGMRIAIPRNLETMHLLDIAPFPHHIAPPFQSLIKVDLAQLAWGAYDSSGQLVNWGPVSGGKNYCPDVHRGCRTPVGNFTVQSKQGAGCYSHKFPVQTHGGAPMPYCMYFKGGFGLHASNEVPGKNASHGCVRMFFEDAKWLNLEFVQVGLTKVRINR